MTNKASFDSTIIKYVGKRVIDEERTYHSGRILRCLFCSHGHDFTLASSISTLSFWTIHLEMSSFPIFITSMGHHWVWSMIGPLCRGVTEFGSVLLLFAVKEIHLPICFNMMISTIFTPRKISDILLSLVGGWRGGSCEDCHNSLFLLGAFLGYLFLLSPKFPLFVHFLRRFGFLNHDALSDSLGSQLLSNALRTVEGGWSGENDHPLNLWR